MNAPHYPSCLLASEPIPLNYVRAGLALVPIPLGQKGPRARGWNREDNTVRDEAAAAQLNGSNIGLAHRWSGTCAIDVDCFEIAEPWLREHGVDLSALLAAPDAVQIVSGREGRAKLIYRLPEDVEWLPSINLCPYTDADSAQHYALELRCASRDGTTLQCVLPPSIHPDTGKPYEWRGDWRQIPVIPKVFLALWRSLAPLEHDTKSNGKDTGASLDLPALAKVYDAWAHIPGALACIPADCSYDEWFRVGMAIQWAASALAQLEAGYALWDTWSKGPPDKPASKYPGERDVRAQWLSFHADKVGGITIATLFEIAKRYGWRPSAPDASGLFGGLCFGEGDAAARGRVDAFTSDGKPRKQSDVLIDIGRTHDLFHGTDATTYARVGPAVHIIDSTRYREILATSYMQLARKGANRNALTDATITLSAYAREGTRHPVWVRTGQHEGGIAIDLGGDDHAAIVVSAQGWRVACESPIRFRRAGKIRPLPVPVAPGEFARLWRYLNVAPQDRVLVAAFLLSALRPSGPYPILAWSGEQGTGKTTGARVVCALVDPCGKALRSAPKEVRDLMVGALNSWMPAFDNLSWMPAPLSDALCCLSTGGAISERTLYTNAEETLIEIMRPVIMNGIEDLANRPDLAQRCIHIELEPLAQMRDEATFWRDFERDAPNILAGLLDALAMAVRNVASVKVDRLPRMADFALWACAGLPALGFSAESFLESYRANNDNGLTAALDGSAFGQYLVQFARTAGEWEGTAAGLLTAVSVLASEAEKRSRSWPKSPRATGGAVRRLAAALRLSGIDVVTDRDPGKSRARKIHLKIRG